MIRRVCVSLTVWIKVFLLRGRIRATLEGFRVRNFGVLKNVTLGRLWDKRKDEALTPMIAIIGKNGEGKSALFDAFR